MSIQERWGKRELEKQFRQALFERTVLHPPKLSALLREQHSHTDSHFKDAYMLEFLALPSERWPSCSA